MPIYAYRCESCGFNKEVLQKMSDPVLTDCPECGKSTFKKQVTAAGFQLKGSGWYVTDFREGGSNTTGKPAVSDTSKDAKPAETAGAKGDAPAKSGQDAAGASATPAASPSNTSAAPAASGATGSSGGSSAAPAAAPTSSTGKAAPSAS